MKIIKKIKDYLKQKSNKETWKMQIKTPLLKKTIVIDDETEEYLFDNIVEIMNGEKATILMITDVKLKSHYIDISHGFYMKRC